MNPTAQMAALALYRALPQRFLYEEGFAATRALLAPFQTPAADYRHSMPIDLSSIRLTTVGGFTFLMPNDEARAAMPRFVGGSFIYLDPDWHPRIAFESDLDAIAFRLKCL